MLKGLYPALITPYKENCAIDFEAYRKLIRRMKNAGMQGLFLTGSTSEFVLLSKEEREQLISVAVDEAGEGLQTIAQCAADSMEESIDIAQYAQRAGVNAIAAVPPRYYKFNAKEIENFYHTLCKNVDIDVLAYDIPALTGVELLEERFDGLASPKNFIGFKATSPNLYLQERFLRLNPGKIILHGFDESLASALVIGVQGGVGGTYALLPELFQKLYQSAVNGDFETAKELQHKVNPVLDGMIPYNHTKAVKYLLMKEGIGNGLVRAPFLNFDSSVKRELDKVYELICMLNREIKAA